MKRLMLLLVAATLVSGCFMNRYEYRYRVFYGVDLEGKENLTTEDFSKLFYPLGSLNRAMDSFGEEGFELYDFERLGQGHNHIFKFRRPTKKSGKRTLPERKKYGIYRVKKDDKSILLAVMPTPDGVEILELGELPKRYTARDDGGRVIYKTSEGQTTLSFKPEEKIQQSVKTLKGNATVIKNYEGAKVGK